MCLLRIVKVLSSLVVFTLPCMGWAAMERDPRTYETLAIHFRKALADFPLSLDQWQLNSNEFPLEPFSVYAINSSRLYIAISLCTLAHQAVMKNKEEHDVLEGAQRVLAKHVPPVLNDLRLFFLSEGLSQPQANLLVELYSKGITKTTNDISDLKVDGYIDLLFKEMNGYFNGQGAFSPEWQQFFFGHTLE